MLRVACQRPRTDNLSRTFSRQIHASKTLFHPLSFFGSAKASPIGAAPPSWKNAVLQAEELVQVGGSVINPKELLGRDISLLTENIRRLLGSGHPVLNTISTYYFSEKGKHIRPIIVLLMAQATNLSSMGKQSANPATEQEINLPISDASQSILFKPAIESLESSESIMPAQRRLAEITEMIHTASLLHDDVIDVSMTRRGSATANAEFGNKMAVLAGDFLLARASVALARLRNVQVVELLATVISNLVEGEIMQLRNSAYDNTIYKWQEPGWCPPGAVLASDIKRFEYYMEKTYMKTASLIAKSSRAATVLGGCSREISNAAYIYGRNLGLAFQVIFPLL